MVILVIGDEKVDVPHNHAIESEYIKGMLDTCGLDHDILILIPDKYHNIAYIC